MRLINKLFANVLSNFEASISNIVIKVLMKEEKFDGEPTPTLMIRVRSVQFGKCPEYESLVKYEVSALNDVQALLHGK